MGGKKSAPKISSYVRHFHSNTAVAMKVLGRITVFIYFCICLEMTVPNWNAITDKTQAICILLLAFSLQY